MVLNFLHGKREKKEKFFALEGVSFSACAGEVLGIIGSNGAGKTTLCGVIGRVLRPDTGTISVKGEVSALLSMGTGFQPDLTGRENVFLNGLMLGFSRRDIRELYGDIAEFAGLNGFMDTRIKYYSSGMRSRLGFSIAAMLNPEVLVLDEALGAGDAEFAERASRRLKDLVAGARMVVVVTHNLGFIRSTCHRAIWIDAGNIRAEGGPDAVASAYEESVPPRQSKKILTPAYEAPDTTVGERLVARVQDLDVRFRLNRKPFYALKGVSFDIRQGEIVGVIGANGAGKTTLCRALSRIYRPDGGAVEVFHRISALLSMGTGFNKDLAAADNIILNGLMLGMKKKRMKKLVQPILEFAELEKQRNKPVKYFSKGMKSRLAFSIAVAVHPGLLIIDEALSAGDLSFKQKATEAMDEMIAKAEAVIVVSHNLSFVQSVCTRAVWIDRGRLEYDGDPEEAVKRYRQSLKK
jgi:teichoic acid transport system ATP-binding protein